eukprot:gene29412-5761_t
MNKAFVTTFPESTPVLDAVQDNFQDEEKEEKKKKMEGEEVKVKVKEEKSSPLQFDI